MTCCFQRPSGWEPTHRGPKGGRYHLVGENDDSAVLVRADRADAGRVVIVPIGKFRKTYTPLTRPLERRGCWPHHNPWRSGGAARWPDRRRA